MTNTQPAVLSDLLTIKQVAKLLQCSTQTVYRQVTKGDFPLPVLLTGRRRFFITSEVNEWLANRPRGFGQMPSELAKSRGLDFV